MDLTVWLSAMIVLALVAFTLMFGFVSVCDKV